MRSMVEGLLPSPQNPSTALRAVPLPREISGRNFVRYSRLSGSVKVNLAPWPGALSTATSPPIARASRRAM
jgi:hypothetical protein